jgi:hypothetical protein
MTGSCDPDRHDAVSYAPYPQNIPAARRRVAQLANEWGHPGVADDAALLASELCTNAVLHGCRRDRLFRVETSLTGNALGRWAVERLTVGKIVWAELDIPGASDA